MHYNVPYENLYIALYIKAISKVLPKNTFKVFINPTTVRPVSPCLVSPFLLCPYMVLPVSCSLLVKLVPAVCLDYVPVVSS